MSVCHLFFYFCFVYWYKGCQRVLAEADLGDPPLLFVRKFWSDTLGITERGGSGHLLGSQRANA